MNFRKVFELLIPEFQKNKVEFALIGGLALPFAGVARATMDIDFMVLLNQTNQLDGIMQNCGYEVFHKNKDVANYFSAYPGLGQIDFLFAHRKYALEMLKRAENKNVLGFQMKVAGPEDLIGLKVQSSSNEPQRYYRDMGDIEQIINYQKQL